MADFTLRHFIDVFFFAVSWMDSNLLFIFLAIIVYCFFIAVIVITNDRSRFRYMFDDLALKLDNFPAWAAIPLGFLMLAVSWIFVIASFGIWIAVFIFFRALWMSL
tara:strand:+ start:79 stop:396 length:318 start_codon:yes stop_codon:yes gene_type:complete